MPLDFALAISLEETVVWVGAALACLFEGADACSVAGLGSLAAVFASTGADFLLSVLAAGLAASCCVSAEVDFAAFLLFLLDFVVSALASSLAALADFLLFFLEVVLSVEVVVSVDCVVSVLAFFFFFEDAMLVEPTRINPARTGVITERSNFLRSIMVPPK